MKALVVGLGSMGGKRMRILREMGIEIVGTDMRPERREQAREKYGVKCYATFEEAVRTRSDVMLVCTGPHDHMKYVKYALEHGIHVFSEDTRRFVPAGLAHI